MLFFARSCHASCLPLSHHIVWAVSIPVLYGGPPEQGPPEQGTLRCCRRPRAGVGAARPQQTPIGRLNGKIYSA
ncbi:hypothetical protein DFH27DRAFT_564197 [Peziza echinospora]|nr:hypothetical protein DFH27DRAFT_566793 [Peziza echinospora]KAI5795297.1 hypothetical protein DFH27DRAFT_564197 [Peziza echinospora]